MTNDRQPDSLTEKILSQAQAIRAVEDDEPQPRRDTDAESGNHSEPA